MGNIFKSKKGFGLLEVLVSAVIVIMILSSLVMIGRRALANSAYYEQRAQAIFLAQESMETVRQIRDTNWIDKDNSTEWRDFVYVSALPKKYQCVGCVGGLTSSTDLRVNPSLVNNRRFLIADNQKDIISNLGGINFERVIRIYPGTELGDLLPYAKDGNGEIIKKKTNVNKDENAVKVEVRVSWKFEGDHSINVSEILTNWRPNF